MKKFRVVGKVFSGLGEGAKYLKMPWYVRQIKERLGYIPYPGTLNVLIGHDQGRKLKEMLKGVVNIRLDPYFDGRRWYVGASCYNAIINDSIRCTVIYPDKTYYDESVIELMAPVYLRGLFNLKDGDYVTVDIIMNYHEN